jgi:hypothetical protein
VRQRAGQANTQRGALRFCQELIRRVRRAGASGEILVRADSGFWNKKVCAYLTRQGCRFSIGVNMQASVGALVAQISDEDWEPVADYPDSGVCELAETMLGSERLIVRRVHLHAHEAQGELFTYWRYHAFITNRSQAMHLIDSEHRQHAVVELVIRDLKDQALAHFPSGHYSANSAWTVIACLAHKTPTGSSPAASATSHAGRCCSASPTRHPARLRPPVGDCSRCPAGSPAPPDAAPCISRRAGRGRPASSKRSPASARSPPSERQQLPRTSTHATRASAPALTRPRFAPATTHQRSPASDHAIQTSPCPDEHPSSPHHDQHPAERWIEAK